jgi:hypothetical protein
MHASSSIARYIPYPSHPKTFIILIVFGEEQNLLTSLLCSFLQLCIISSFFGQNILLSTLFPNKLSLCYSINTRDQVLHPYETIPFPRNRLQHGTYGVHVRRVTTELTCSVIHVGIVSR